MKITIGSEYPNVIPLEKYTHLCFNRRGFRRALKSKLGQARFSLKEVKVIGIPGEYPCLVWFEIDSRKSQAKTHWRPATQRKWEVRTPSVQENLIAIISKMIHASRLGKGKM